MDYTGGCQCGAVRYRATGPRGRASVCYCRMCQRAAGGPFAAYVRFRVEQVHWTSPPAQFASSNMVERGFCSACGTPLSYHHIGGPYISLTMFSLDHPDAVAPEMSFFAKSRPGWCLTLDDLPDQEMDLTQAPGFENRQSPIGGQEG